MSISPLEEAARSLGLTASQIAVRLGCSQAAVSRYFDGSRCTIPPGLYLLLGSSSLADEHEAWLRATGRRRPRGTVMMEIEERLPPGVSEVEAKAACHEAIAAMRGGGR